MRGVHAWFAAAAIVVLGAALRLHDLGGKELWLDEVYQVVIATGATSVTDLLSGFARHGFEGNPPLTHVATHLSMRLSASEFFARLPSALFGILTVWAVIFLARRWWGMATALVAGGLLALSPVHVAYSQEARPYAALAFFCLISIGSFVEMTRDSAAPVRRAMALHVLSTAAAVYTHYFAALAIVAQGVTLLLREGVLHRSSSAFDWRPLGRFSLSLLGVTVLFAPWVATFWQQATGQVATGLPGAPLDPLLLVLTTRDLSGGDGPWGLAWLLLAVAGAVLGPKETNRARLMSGLWLLVAFPLVLLALHFGHRFLHLRYFVFGLPLLVMLSASGLRELTVLGTHALARRSWPRGGAAAIATAVLGVAAWSSWAGLQSHYQTPKRPWRDVVTFLSEESEADDIILVEPHFLRHPLLYYADAERVFADPATVLVNDKPVIVGSSFLLSNREDIVAMRRVWYVTSKDAPDWVLRSFAESRRFDGLVGPLVVYSNEGSLSGR